jgi:hypothetical protein
MKIKNQEILDQKILSLIERKQNKTKQRRGKTTPSLIRAPLQLSVESSTRTDRQYKHTVKIYGK